MNALDALTVAVGGAMGGVLRFWLAGLCTWLLGTRFPWGILFVNVSGAGLIGALAALQSRSVIDWSQSMSLLIFVGLLGSYTTVSSFALQTWSLLQQQRPIAAGLNALTTLFLCLLAVAAGWQFVGGQL